MVDIERDLILILIVRGFVSESGCDKFDLLLSRYDEMIAKTGEKDVKESGGDLREKLLSVRRFDFDYIAYVGDYSRVKLRIACDGDYVLWADLAEILDL